MARYCGLWCFVLALGGGSATFSGTMDNRNNTEPGYSPRRSPKWWVGADEAGHQQETSSARLTVGDGVVGRVGGQCHPTRCCFAPIRMDVLGCLPHSTT